MTAQHYHDLVKLHQSYAGKLVILAFPCNQFGQQEPGSASEIRRFAISKDVPCDEDSGFHLMEKVDVNGDGTHPVYRFLKGATPDTSDILWNFGSYWLVDVGGGVRRLQGLKNYPSNFVGDIEEALKA